MANVDDDLDDVWVEPYDCTSLLSEPRPDSVIYQPIFEDLKVAILGVVDLLRNPLLESPFQNVITNSLLQEVKHRTKENVSDQVMFALVGDMASGKAFLPSFGSKEV